MKRWLVLLGCVLGVAAIGIVTWEPSHPPRDMIGEGAAPVVEREDRASLDGSFAGGRSAPLPRRTEGPAGGPVRYEAHVVDARGMPASGAVVRLEGPDVIEGIVADEKGRLVAWVRAGRYDVTARTSAGATVLRTGVLVAEAVSGGAVLTVTKAPALRVRVTLGPEGAPGVRVRVFAGYDHARNAAMRGARLLGEGTTGADGLVSIAGVPRGTHELDLTFPFGGSFRRRQQHVDASVLLVDLPELTPAPVSGRITDAATGMPVRGASITFRSIEQDHLHGLVVTARSRSDGRYAAAIPDGPHSSWWMMRVDAKGYWVWKPEGGSPLTNIPGSGLTGLNASLDPMASRTAAGRVVSLGGRGIGGVPVSFWVRGRDYREPSLAEVRTYADGSFFVPALPAGSYYAAVRASPWRTHKGVSFALGPKREAPGFLQIEVAPEGSLQGRVVDVREAPVVGARVWVHGGYERNPVPANGPWPGEVFTDAQGRWQVRGLDPRKGYYVDAAWRGLRSRRVHWTPAARANEPNTLRLKPAVTIRGLVRDRESGAGVPFARLELRPPAWRRGGPNEGVFRYRVECDAAGRFEVHALEPARWRLYGLGDHEEYERLDLRGSAGLVNQKLWLDPGFIVAGVVTDSAGTPVVAHARLNGRYPPDRINKFGTRINLRSQSDDSGSFRFTFRRKGDYTIGFTAPGYKPALLKDIHGGERELRVVMERLR